MFNILKFSANSVNSLPVEKKCVPFVSEYSTCNDDNMCSGCTKCTCSSIATWTCQDVRLCEGNDNDADRTIDEEDEIFDNALTMLESAIDQNKLPAQKPKHPNVPDPQPINENSLLGGIKDYKMEDILTALMRPKRSATKTETKNSKHNKRSIEKSFKHPKTSNNTIKFYDTIDELNEDTLKNSNITGTLPAKKMDIIPKIEITRRSGGGENVSQSLHIEYNQPKAYNPITDNKIDGLDHDNKFDASHENLKTILGNHSQVLKDKDLSKIVVNELKKGSEVIGDSDAPVTSNITFTPENDTLTAMAFIAGNLLNKLWNMEKDSPGASAETDVVKHEKITNLLDLFKEPLNLRQETFLKNALEQLSTAIDKTKDVNNISICENIEEAKKRTFNGNDTNAGERPIISTAPCKQKKVKDEEDKEKKATVVAISKINNVLELIKKFETVQGHISELKHGPKLDFHDQTASQTKEHADKAELLSKEESNSLSIFGNILEKITRLLMPHRNNKKIAGQIKNKNLFGKNDNVMDKFKKLYNIDLSNMTVTAKDKLILDYLTHIDGNPDCLLNTKGQQGYKTLPNIEGNILLNLSEFFKMKSFSDLVKLLEPAEPHPVLRTPTVETTTKLVQTTTILELNKISKTLKDIDSVKFNSTKEKLKAHLKTIIEDLVELQNAKGINVKGNIKIADALPCIYNIINAGREQAVKKEDDIESGKKIIEIFNGLKKELKTAYSRRSFSNNPIPKERPKSAAVWERIVKNLNEKSKVKTRRLSEIPIPKSYDEIKEMMDGLENVSSTYKHKALLNDVLPASKLMMLKALDQDVQKSINVMEEIKLAYKTLSKLPADKFIEFEEFVGNVATSINLNEKITEKVKPTDRKYFVNEINSGNRLKNKLKKKSSLRYGEVQDNDDMRISRNQILNQLIKNRMQLYLKMKDDKEFDVNNDMNYNIAKRVLYYLDAGNYDLAREMFKVFVIQKQDKLGIALSNDGILDQLVDTTTPKFNDIPMRRMASHEKSPLIQFKEPTRLNHEMNFVNQDHLIKQLLNIKNMGM